MATPVYVSGKSGSVTWNSVVLNVTKWSGTHKVEVLDVTHSGASGNRVRIPGLVSFEGSFEANFDSANPNYLTPPNLNAGTIANLSLTTSAANGTFACSALIESVEYSSEVDGLVTYTASFVSTGAVTLPVS